MAPKSALKKMFLRKEPTKVEMAGLVGKGRHEASTESSRMGGMWIEGRVTREQCLGWEADEFNSSLRRGFGGLG